MMASSRSSTKTACLVVLITLVLVSAIVLEFTPSQIKGFFVEQFTNDWSQRWKPSEAKKIIADADKDAPEEWRFDGVWSVEEPTVYPGLKGDTGLVVKSPARHHAISAAFPTTLDPRGKTLVIQYEVKLQNLLECGGAYMKLLTKQQKPFSPQAFDDKAPYTIMFGPDRCGATNKVHFIFRHRNPLTGVYEEKHLQSPPAVSNLKTSTLYTLIVRPDNTYDINVDGETVKTGSLLEDFLPAVNPPKEIDDETDVKPTDWVDDAKIPDPSASKPADWNEDAPMYVEDADAVKPADWLEKESPLIDDPASVKPEEWNDEEDGDWVPNKIPNPACAGVSGCGPWKRPMKKNPDYKGKWFAPLIENPAYKGPWVRRKIPNPDYYEDLTPANFEPMYAVGFELWTLQSEILFDNIYIGFSEEEAKKFAAETWAIKAPIEKAAQEEAEGTKKAEEEAQEGSLGSLAKDSFASFIDIMEDFQEDPQAALKKHATILGAAAAALIILIILTKRLFGGRAPSKTAITAAAAAKKKKLDDASSEKKAASTTDSPSAKENKVTENATGLKSRAAAAAKKE